MGYGKILGVENRALFATISGVARANRHIEPGHTYHLTHRCHNRSFLLRFARDRKVYRTIMRERLSRYGISLLTYCITSNHTHLLLQVRDQTTQSLARFMQSLEGDFAQYYNHRKKRQGAFWADRYHAVMIQNGRHLLRCLRYIDLNMVRAGVVEHPSQWEWTGYTELMGGRRRNRLLDLAALSYPTEVEYPEGLERFRIQHRESICEALARLDLQRQAYWTESLAIGDREWVQRIGRKIRNRGQVAIEPASESASSWQVGEKRSDYSTIYGNEISPENRSIPTVSEQTAS